MSAVKAGSNGVATETQFHCALCNAILLDPHTYIVSAILLYDDACQHAKSVALNFNKADFAANNAAHQQESQFSSELLFCAA